MASGYPFVTTIGFRQGITLSSDLFKIFINDLPDIFDDNCHGVGIGAYYLNCLLYADDFYFIIKE